MTLNHSLQHRVDQFATIDVHALLERFEFAPFLAGSQTLLIRQDRRGDGLDRLSVTACGTLALGLSTPASRTGLTLTFE